jgi:hypothetical protein
MFKGLINKAKAIKESVESSDAFNTAKHLANDSLDKAKTIKETVESSDTLSSAKQFASNGLDNGKLIANDAFDKYWPKVESIIVNGLLSTAEEKLKDDQMLENMIEKAYEVLPTAVRLILPRTKFIEFSMKRRDPILIKVQEYKAKKEADLLSIEHITNEKPSLMISQKEV